MIGFGYGNYALFIFRLSTFRLLAGGGWPASDFARRRAPDGILQPKAASARMSTRALDTAQIQAGLAIRPLAAWGFAGDGWAAARDGIVIFWHFASVLVYVLTVLVYVLTVLVYVLTVLVYVLTVLKYVLSVLGRVLTVLGRVLTVIKRELFYDRVHITEIGNSLVAQAIQDRIVDWLED